ncbi:ATP-binding protein [Anaerobacillus isosaccharinicus]|uniref:histidine kinase n=1 Tax=Anaerobacillus isosaccharinicus TaxID=1532552 RepID=A0A1S2L5I8_9BACI|nr:ATP-binding protein [Anaerobacillus isosaccharinicus]MBA5584500.1 PAS domain-containing protein [Anaerobacillus isosaccharinicus]QOY37116.1 PAS domain-containing protein [Anaerobacillus isosaccharinicus]
MNTEPLYIINSKYNCKNKYNLDPADIPRLTEVLQEQEITNERRKYQEIINVTKHFMSKLLLYMEGVPSLFIITNDSGVIIEIFGDNDLKNIFGVIPGIMFDEETSGTNSVSLCLKHKHPIQTIGTQHYHHCFHDFSCTSCLFQSIDHKYNPVVGTVTLMTKIGDSSAFHLGLLSSAIDSIEREITVNVQNRRLQELNQIMINTTCNGIIITDQDGIITSFNESAEKMFDINQLLCVGKSICVIEEISHYFINALEKNQEIINAEICYQIGKEKKYIIIDVLPIFDQKKDLIGCYGQFRDITERYIMEQQIIENEKLSTIGRLSAGLAHEIRNPLTPIMGFIHLLEKHYQDETAKDYLTIISDELERVNQLVSNFVLTSRPDAPSKKKMNVIDLLERTVIFMKSEATLKNIQIVVDDMLIEKVELSIDANQIKQVLINLIQNAMDVTPSGGKINVTALNDSEGIFIKVIDNGGGITKEESEQLFSPFFSTKENGVGLGLSVCERIVKNHQGKIFVESQLGEGSTFTVYLPLIN